MRLKWLVCIFFFPVWGYSRAQMKKSEPMKAQLMAEAALLEKGNRLDAAFLKLVYIYEHGRIGTGGKMGFELQVRF